jgi:hypothetical protein
MSAGQGSPLIASPAPGSKYRIAVGPQYAPPSTSVRCCAMALLAVCAGLWMSAGLPAQDSLGVTAKPGQVEAITSDDNRIRIRVLWGGGTATAWQGSMVLSSGRFENLTTLGLEPDAGASLYATGDELLIRPLRPSDFHGFDVDLVGSQPAELLLTLTTPDSGKGIERQLIDLSPLLQSAELTKSIQLTLDESGNRVDINRSPGDQLPVVLTRKHLIFDPGEELEFSVRPFRITGDGGRSAQLHVELFANGESRHLTEESLSLDRNGQYYSLDQLVRLSVPDVEGVYEVCLSVRDDSLATRLNLGRERCRRSFQIVVVDPVAGQRNLRADEIVLWQEVFNTRDVRQQWIDKIPGVPQFRVASSGIRREIRPASGVESVNIDGEVWDRIAPGGWQAVPVRISEPEQPHIIEVEFLDEGPMSLGISVLEPDAAGRIEPFGADSGITIPSTAGSDTPVSRRHRIFLWPGHEQPYVLFANRHASRPATVGAIRVLAGPGQLAAADRTSRASTAAGTEWNGRQYLSFYEQPLFAENFSAGKAIDPVSGQTWQDWNTFLKGAVRWTQYLKANGYTAAMLVVAGDGSSLYPSRLLQPGPRYDSGVFAPTGQDPLRKDVVELLLRIFEREGLQLVPVFHFNSPLPALEQIRLTGAPDTEGITLVDLQGVSRTGTLREADSAVAIYNPLDQRVQSAYADIVGEFVERYAGRVALGGLGFLYSRDAVQVLPGQAWGVDRQTMSRFQRDTGIPVSRSADWIADLLGNENRAVWLEWRQQRMAEWLDELQSIAAPVKRLYLLGGDLLVTQDAFSAVAPSLRRNCDLEDAYARVAVPIRRIAGDSRLVFLQPQELSPEKSLADQRLNIHVQQSYENTRLFADFANRGTLFSHRYAWAEFEQLRQQNLFGEGRQESLVRMQPLSPAGFWNRQRLARSIADHDSQTLVEGGWLTGLGQEEHVAPLVEVFTQLPDVRFTDVEADLEGQPLTGMVVRQAVVGDRNWFYVVNPSPWSLRGRIRFSGRETVLESLGSRLEFDTQAEAAEVVVQLPPFSLEGGFTRAGITVTGYQAELPDWVVSVLQDRLNSLLTKVSRAARIEPLDVLQNPGFEPVGNGAEAPRQFGWSFDHRVHEAVTLKQEGTFAGAAALSLVSRGAPTWVRSNDFPAPETGRLSVSVMIRTENPGNPPPLRISIQGDDGRQIYYRYGMVGGQSRQVTAEWQEFAVHFDDLPLGPDKGNLRIGFDLMGQGQVDIDQVQVFDRWLDGQDSRSLMQLLALAGFQLTDKKDVERCRRILDSYWPRFLDEFFPDTDAAEPATQGTDGFVTGDVAGAVENGEKRSANDSPNGVDADNPGGGR